MFTQRSTMPEGSNKKQHKSIKEEKHMKANQTKVKKKGRTVRAFKRDLSLWLFCVPGVVLTFIFSYIPMYGIQLAFRRYNAKAGILGSPWVGLYYFQRFFSSPYFGTTIKNTLILSLYGLLVSFPLPIILALMLNSLRFKKYRKVIQTVTYAPNFISTVVMYGPAYGRVPDGVPLSTLQLSQALVRSFMRRQRLTEQPSSS